MSKELPLGRTVLTEETRVNIKSVKQTSKNSITCTFDKDGQSYQDRFDATPEQIDQMLLEAAGKDVWATVKPDTSDKGLDPEVIEVEVVGND